MWWMLIPSFCRFECFCARQGPPQHRIKPDDNCNKKCPGDSAETCGGGWRIQIYKTPLAGKAPHVTLFLLVLVKTKFNIL